MTRSSPNASARSKPAGDVPLLVLGMIFALSGVAALTYQIVWQRMLFLVYGVDIEAVTVIVSVFMFGLGCGALLGGQLADLARRRCGLFFCVFELAIGLFGLASGSIIHSLGMADSLWLVAAKTSALLLLPTMLMGATLPLLSVAIVEKGRQVGEAVGYLYYFNTLGAGLVCIFLGVWFFNHFTLSQALWLACGANFTAALSGWLLWKLW